MSKRGAGNPPESSPGFGIEPDAEKLLREQIASSPDPPSLFQFLARYQSRNGLPSDRQQLLALACLCGQSPFLGELLLQNPGYLTWVVGHLSAEGTRTAEDLREDLARFGFISSELSDFAILRRFKLREYLRIALRDFFGKADLAETTRELSLLADVLLEEATRVSLRELLKQHGAPQYNDDSGKLCEATFAVLALGKLGGGELNYSSDIDLIYVYSREGQTAGRDADPDTVISNREFFTRVGERITNRIAGISPEGQVFRVDLGLRPGGKDGDLVLSRRSLLSYYRTWARTWEKQALIKVRASAGDPSLGEELVRELRTCIDAPGSGVLAALDIKEMKDRIDEELSLSGRSELDLKLGRGGIRELEFAVQALQMGHGRRQPWVHEGNTLRALHRLADKDLVTYGEHSSVARAYAFLRTVEHRLQLERNRQTYLLPVDAREVRILARRLGFLEEKGSRSFLEELERHRQVVRLFYDRVIGTLAQPSLEGVDPDPLLDPVPDSSLASLIGPTPKTGSGRFVRPLQRIRRLFSPEQIRPSERRGVRRVSAAILEEATSAQEPDRVFARLEKFLSSLLVEPVARQAFFENAEWIPPLVRLLSKSEHLALILTRRPQILEELGGVREALKDWSLAGLTGGLGALLDEAGGVREASAILRRFHQRQVLFTGFRDVHRQDSLGRTLQRLTDLAQACLTEGERTSRRLAPGPGSNPRFCVLGLGRLGYRELDYNSDLDLVFVVEAPRNDAPLEKTRKQAECLIHLLTAITQEGSLYSVDLRLRPAGSEGELLQTSRGLVEYFGASAHTWEKMAVLKARPVAGDLDFGRQVRDLLMETAFESLDRSTLGAQIRQMKEELEQSVPRLKREWIPLKLGAGGLLDIHFIIEFLQLQNRVPGPPDRDTLRMLTDLHVRRLLPDREYSALYAGYLLLRCLDHALRLLYDQPGDFVPTTPGHLARLAQEVGRALADSGDASGEALLAVIQETRESIRGCFDRLII
jgi:glutamate-ammonia-ligase adenylyltransferase